MARRGFDGASTSHSAPIPAACRAGPLIVSSLIAPFDPGTRNLPSGLSAQIENLFGHIDDVLQTAGARRDDLVKVSFFVSSGEARQIINEHWVSWFPDKTNSPARHIHELPQHHERVPTCEFLAYTHDTRI